MIHIGIDPGLDGAIAFLDIVKGHMAILDMPTVEIMRNNKKKREVSAIKLACYIDIGMNAAGEPQPATIFLERVNAMPGQGVTSMFSLGRSVGIVEGVVAGIGLPITIVPPRTWQKAANVRDGKDGSRQRAMELFPAYAGLFARKKDNGRSDAALLAWYGATL